MKTAKSQEEGLTCLHILCRYMLLRGYPRKIHPWYIYPRDIQMYACIQGHDCQVHFFLADKYGKL